MAIDVRELQTRPLDPIIAEELDIFERTVAEYLDGRVDEDVFRVFRLNHGVYGQRQGGHNQMLRVKVPHGRVTPEQLETFALHRRDVLARLGSPHHPPERAVPLRAARADARDPAPAGVGRPHVARGVRRHRAQRHGLPPRRRVPAGDARHHAVGRGDRRLPAAPPVRAAPAPQVQDQLLGLRDRLRPGDVQRRRRHRDHPHARRRHRTKPASRCSSPAASAPTRTPRRRSRSSPPAKTCCRRSRRACARSTTTATATTRSAPA